MLLSGCSCGPSEAHDLGCQETRGSSLCRHLVGEGKNFLPILENEKIKTFYFNHGKKTTEAIQNHKKVTQFCVT